MARSVFWADRSRIRALVDEVCAHPERSPAPAQQARSAWPVSDRVPNATAGHAPAANVEQPQWQAALPTDVEQPLAEPTVSNRSTDLGTRLDRVMDMAAEHCGASRVFIADGSGLPLRTAGHDDADFVASAALAKRHLEQMRDLLQVEDLFATGLMLPDGSHVTLIEAQTPAGPIILGFESATSPSPQRVQQLQATLRDALVEWEQNNDG